VRFFLSSLTSVLVELFLTSDAVQQNVMRLPMRVLVSGLLSFLAVSWVIYWFDKNLADVVRLSKHGAEDATLETNAALSICPERLKDKRIDPWEPSTVLRDGARRRFRCMCQPISPFFLDLRDIDNLRNDVHYITGWTTAGFSKRLDPTALSCPS